MSDVIAIKSPDGMVVIAHGFAVGGSATASVPTGTGFRHVTADVEDDTVTTLAALKTSLLLTGTNSGDQDLSGYQPLDSDLTAIAALSTTSYGRSLLALADAAAGRTLLGLGTAATTAASAYDAAGAAAAAQAASQPLDSDLTAIAALVTTVYGRSFLALADAAAGRTALGLGTAAVSATGDFDASGAAAAAQAASQPLDSDLTAIAALTTTVFGRAFLALADAAAGRTALGLGTLATQSGTFSGTSSGTNTGDQTITLTGGVTGSGTGSFAATVVTNANLTGDVTSVGNATTLTNAPVIAKVLTGYSSGAGTVAATDSILQAIQKLDGNNATNANLTGVITSVGNATSIASQTGTGNKFVVDTSPVLVTPNLGTPTSGTLTNCSGYTVANLSGAGTGVLTALGVNVGSAGAPVTFNGAGGTPSSMTGTNITGIPPAAVTGTAAILGANSYTAGQTIAPSAGVSHLTLNGSTSGSAILTTPAAAAGIFQLGAADADTNATIVAQTLRTQGLAAGGTSNQAGANFTVIVSPGKGTGAGGSFIVQTAPAGSTGTTVGTPATALTIDSTKLATFASGVTANGALISINNNNSGPLGLAISASSSFNAYNGFGVPGGSDSTNGFLVWSNQAKSARFSDKGIFVTTTGAFGFTSDTTSTTLQDLVLTRSAAATLQQGAANAASPVAQTLQAQGSRGGTDTNVAGAAYTMNAGLGTGNSVPATHTIGGGATSATSGTAAQTAVPRIISGASKVLANNTVTTVANVTNASNTSAAGTIDYTVEVWDGTNLQYEVGSISYGINNKGGAFTQNSTTKYGNTQGATSGTLTVTWTITAANPGAIQINANSSLTPSTGYPRVTYQLQNLAQQAVVIA